VLAASIFAAKLVNWIKLDPATAVKVPTGQLSAGAGEAAMTSPAGKLSMTVIPDIPTSIGAVTVILNRLVAPGCIGVVRNDLLTPTGRVYALTTVKSVPVRMIVVFLGPSAVVIAPTGIVFS